MSGIHPNFENELRDQQFSWAYEFVPLCLNIKVEMLQTLTILLWDENCRVRIISSSPALSRLLFQKSLYLEMLLEVE